MYSDQRLSCVYEEHNASDWKQHAKPGPKTRPQATQGVTATWLHWHEDLDLHADFDAIASSPLLHVMLDGQISEFGMIRKLRKAFTLKTRNRNLLVIGPQSTSSSSPFLTV